jgi:Circularly permutated YpsA SLOG family
MALHRLTVISGGQTGADLAALEAARYCFHSTDGYMPKGFETDSGSRPDIAQKYGLKESDGGYAARDMQNVDMSDALVAFLLTLPKTGRGTTCTIRYAQLGQYSFLPIDQPPYANHLVITSGKKPILVIWINGIEHDSTLADISTIIRNFLMANQQVKRLMVSGPCESTLPSNNVEVSIQEKIGTILKSALAAPQICFNF